MKKKLNMNLQFFAEPGSEPTGGQGEPAPQPGANQTPPATDPSQPQIDYNKIQQMLDGTLAAKENTALKAYFKQQGLSQEEAEQAMQAFKQQKAANEPNIEAIQNAAQNAQQMAQKAMIERDAYKLSGELGIDLKTMPYVLKLADVSQVVQDGKIDSEKLKEALNKVLEDVPQLKPQEQQQTGFRQIGVGQQHDAAVDADSKAAGGGQAVLQGVDVVLVHHAGLLVSAGPELHLLLEPLLLVNGVVELGERVGVLVRGDEELEAVGEARVVLVALGERGHLDGVVDDERRVDEDGLAQLVEELGDQLTGGPLVLVLDTMLGAGGA